MIISIDRSPLWRPHLAGKEELSQILEAFFRSRPMRRPASDLEVRVLADALECPEADIEQYFAQPRKQRGPADPARDSGSSCSTRSGDRTRLQLMQPKVPPSYSTTKPT
jgi:hypothetical protein